MAPLIQARTRPILLLSLLTFSLLAATTTAAAGNFIQSQCSSTKYPTTCVTSLQSYASKIQRSSRQLAHTALMVSLAKARYARTYVGRVARGRPGDAGPVRDCLEEIGDTVDRLGKSVREFQAAARAGRRDFMWRMNNVQTWASAALTDENTCVDGFEGRAVDGQVRDGIKAQMEGVMQCTSNALALVNQFANRYL